MTASIDQQFIEFIVKSLVSKPDAVSIERTIDEKGVLLSLTVDPEDLGRVIGKRGATAQSLRTLLRALGTKNDARYNLKIVDNGEGPDRSAKTDKKREHKASRQKEEPVKESEEEIPLDDDLQGEETDNQPDSDMVAKTRRDLADLDDLDI
jgi:predicted RNA-binding protein YlqC (UPF0109 family)